MDDRIGGARVRELGDGGEPPDERPDAASVDLAALEALYRGEYRESVRLARLLTGDLHRGEELAQEAFVRISPLIGTLDEPAAYLRTVLVNLCRDHGRRQTTVKRNPPPPPGTTDEPALPRDVDAVWQAVIALPPRRRDAVILRYWHDLTTAEVARLMGVRPGTARSLIHRGLAALQEVLTDDR